MCYYTGYVLSCLPSLSEECMKIHEQIELIKNLKLTPDFVINIKVYQHILYLHFCLEAATDFYVVVKWTI